MRSHVRRTSVVRASRWKLGVGVNHLRNRILEMLPGWLSYCFLSGNVTSLRCRADCALRCELVCETLLPESLCASCVFMWFLAPFPGLVCMKSSTSVVELVMLLCSQVSNCLPSSAAPHPPSFLPVFLCTFPLGEGL